MQGQGSSYHSQHHHHPFLQMVPEGAGLGGYACVGKDKLMQLIYSDYLDRNCELICLERDKRHIQWITSSE